MIETTAGSFSPGGHVVTIELGEVGAARPEAGDGRVLSLRLRRGLLAAVVAMICLLSVGGSTPLETGLGEPVWTASVSLSGISVGPDNLYLVASTGRSVLARDLRTGAIRWRLDTTEVPLYTRSVAPGIAAVITQHEPETLTSLPESDFTFVDERTGATVGRTTSDRIYQPSVVAGGGLVVVRMRADCPADDLCLDVVKVDARTSTETWKLSLPPNTTLQDSYVDGLLTGFLTVTDQGTVEIRSPRTGAVVDRGPMPVVEATTMLMLLPDSFITASLSDRAATVTAYQLGSATRRWQVSAQLPALSQDWPLSNLTDCGPVVCLYAGTGNGSDGRTVLLDRATGRVRATTATQVFAAVGDRVLLASPLSDQRIPVSTLGSVSVLDAGDGHLIASYPSTLQVSWPGGGGRGLLLQQGAGRTGFIVIDLDGSLRPIGSVPGVGLECIAQAEILACGNHAGRLQVWRIPPPP